MMIFTNSQREMFKNQASFMLSESERWKDDRKMLIGRVCALMEEACSTGYAMAQYEVCSTPWEYRTDAVSGEVLTRRAAEGWEPIPGNPVFGGVHIILRRRVAVREIENRKIQEEVDNAKVEA